MSIDLDKPLETAAPDVRDRADVRRQVRLVVVFAVVAALLTFFLVDIDDFGIRYSLAERITKDDLPKDFDAHGLLLGCLVLVVVALGLAAANLVPRNGWALVLFVLVGVAFLAGFIIWNFTDQAGSGAGRVFFNPMPEAIRRSTPIILGALAGVLCERAGVINIAIEGQFIAGAFFASVASSLAYSAEAGLVGGVLAGVFIAALLGVFAMKYHVNQVVLGVVLVAFAGGLTSFFLSQIPDDPDVRKYLNAPLILDRIEIPGLSDIPVVGLTFFDQNVLVYLMYLSIIVVSFLLYQTRWGLRVRSVGEHPKAADTVGIKVTRVRWQAVLLGGVFAGLGGAYFTVGSNGTFDNGVTANYGFIALAAVIMGRWHPIGATAAALFFGFMLTLEVQLSTLGRVPSEFISAMPYLATVIAVAGFVGRVRPPAADGEPYVKS
ncbi:ABC transporter permease [Nocardioides plantarum]|uniref:ABC transporter permease n=1 Tax=Nocardioides plantarum TaxID=29299 RepID=A0ABV5K775_9ACTN|nr:ABC transporter permease [Nocardioides plantarum]